MTREITFADAMLDTLAETFAEDPQLIMLGTGFMGLRTWKVASNRAQEIEERYAERVYYPPISEAAVAALAVGAAMAGSRVIMHITTASFFFNAWSQVTNEAGNAHYMSGGRTRVPVLFHGLGGLRGAGAAQHSHNPEAMLWNAPGLQIMLPATPADAKGLLRTALRSDNPTVFINHLKLLETKGPDLEAGTAIPFGQALVRRRGQDVTIVASSLMVLRALAAAEELARRGIAAEVVDCRTLVPFDRATVCASVAKTGRLVAVSEGQLRCGVASEIVATVAEQAGVNLAGRVRRVSLPDVPVPAADGMERHIEVSTGKIMAAALQVMERR